MSISPQRLARAVMPLLLMLAVSLTASAQGSEEHRSALSSSRGLHLVIDRTQIAGKGAPAAPQALKIDAALRSLIGRAGAFGKQGVPGALVDIDLPFAASLGDEQWVEVLVEGDPGIRGRIESMGGASRVVQAGNIITARLPLSAVETLAADPGVRFIEVAGKRGSLNNNGRIDIKADQVHSGTNLPAAYQGEGVIVGVIDSGIDFSHPDFSNGGGTRIQYLYEYTQDSQLEWSKQQIDTDPVSVTQRDLDDGGGHGTHVAGTAAGGGQLDARYQGIAPRSDIVFVKGMVGGGFSDVAVVGGCEYIFGKADAVGKPAVINLSLGSNFGPLDGSSLYEQALSAMVGPGRIIVAAAGNDGFNLIHAGRVLPAAAQNATFLLPSSASQSLVNMWFDPGVVSQVAVGALVVDEGEIVYLGNTDFVPVGSFMNHTALTYEGVTLGHVGVDAQTVADPRNGDSNVYIEIIGDPENGVDLTQVIWAVIYDSNVAGRFDMWAFGGEFWPSLVGIDGINEVPGDANLTVGSPASAEKVIAVGSYVTTNSWTDVDGQNRQWQNPDPTRQTEGNVVPQIGQKSYFSSVGPTRDGRTAPDVSAPGELIFSPLSSHLTEGQGYQRGLVVQGGSYVGQQGTSMASPHVTGVVALMLQVNPTLSHEDVLEILTQTARADSWTGSLPNNQFGAGKIDAFAAVSQALGTVTEPPPALTLRHHDPQSSQTLWSIDRALPIDSGFVFGTNRYFDRAKAVAFTLPDGTSSASVSDIRVWFGYRRAGLGSETYQIAVHDGTSSSGPQGEALISRDYPLKDILSDDSFGSNMLPTPHAFDQPVAVGQTFFVSIDFGGYDAAAIGNAAIMATALQGERVPEVWEKWSDGTWHNVSDAWQGQGGAVGSGTDGWHLWVEVDYSTSVSAPDDGREIPAAFALGPNYPNPFNPSTVIPFSLPRTGAVELSVFDVVGRHVATVLKGDLLAGEHEAVFDARDLPSGLYIVRLVANGSMATRKILLVR